MRSVPPRGAPPRLPLLRHRVSTTGFPFTVLTSPFKHARRSAARCASSFPLPRAVDQRVRLNHSARRAEVRKRRRSTSPLAATIQTHNLTNLPLLYDAARAGLIFVRASTIKCSRCEPAWSARACPLSGRACFLVSDQAAGGSLVRLCRASGYMSCVRGCKPIGAQEYEPVVAAAFCGPPHVHL